VSLWPLGGALLVGGSTAAAAFDVAARRVPNALNVSLALAGLLFSLARGGLGGAALSLAGLVVGLGLLFIPFQARWFGGGDVKLAAALGAWVGPFGALWTVLIGVALGGVLAIAVALRSPRDSRRAMWLNLKLAFLSSRVPEVERRPDAQRVPLAVALSISGIAVFWSQAVGRF
jgi:prepilin peptidase CpaA